MCSLCPLTSGLRAIKNIKNVLILKDRAEIAIVGSDKLCTLNILNSEKKEKLRKRIEESKRKNGEPRRTEKILHTF